MRPPIRGLRAALTVSVAAGAWASPSVSVSAGAEAVTGPDESAAAGSNKSSALRTSSSRNWSARQRCHPSSSPAAPNAAWTWLSSESSISLALFLSTLRKARAAPALPLPCPWVISLSNFLSADCTSWTALALTSGATWGLGVLFTGTSGGKPREARSSAAHMGTGGNGACGSCAAAAAWATAPSNASDTACNCVRDASSKGTKRTSRLFQLTSAANASAWVCQAGTSARKASAAATASCQGLVDNTSMRCASNTAASRCTWTRCCRSSTPLMRSVSCVFNDASGSLDNGAPALAASRCHARASAMLRRARSNKACALAAQSWAIASCSFARRISSSFKRRGLAAPLSRALNSLKTSWMRSALGSVASQSRIRAARSPEVGAENAPPVRASRVEFS